MRRAITIPPAAEILRDLTNVRGLTVDEKMCELLAFAASEPYVALRKKVGRPECMRPTVAL
jgi:hypothetical protein